MPTVFGKEVWPCDICGHLKYAETGKHLSNYEITIWCAKVNKNA